MLKKSSSRSSGALLISPDAALMLKKADESIRAVRLMQHVLSRPSSPECIAPETLHALLIGRIVSKRGGLARESGRLCELLLAGFWRHAGRCLRWHFRPPADDLRGSALRRNAVNDADNLMQSPCSSLRSVVLSSRLLRLPFRLRKMASLAKEPRKTVVAIVGTYVRLSS